MLDQLKLAGLLVQHCDELQLTQDYAWQEGVTSSEKGCHLVLPLMVTETECEKSLVRRTRTVHCFDEETGLGGQQKDRVVT